MSHGKKNMSRARVLYEKENAGIHKQLRAAICLMTKLAKRDPFRRSTKNIFHFLQKRKK